MHSWGKFVFTGMGLGLLIGITLSMAGIYRGMVDDAKVLLDNSGADLWVVQKDTLGPYAESSSLYDDIWRGIRGMPGWSGRQTSLISPCRWENKMVTYVPWLLASLLENLGHPGGRHI